MIRWLFARDDGSISLDGTLHPSELSEGQRYRHQGRKRQFQFGRTTAHRLLSETAELPALGPRGLWIHRTDAGWPQVLDGEGRPLPISLSIAHTGSVALCAMGPEGDGHLGADVEQVAPRSQAFLEDFYTDAEQSSLARLPDSDRDRLATLYWTVKEAVLKALRTGLSRSAKDVEVRAVEPGADLDWKTAEVQLRGTCLPEVYVRLCDAGQTAMAIARVAETAAS